MEFERIVRNIYADIIERDGIVQDAEESAIPSNAGRIMPFEFLYLLANARP